MLQIGEIHQLPPPLLLRILPVKAPQQLQQPPDGRRRILKIRHDPLRRRIEARLRILERLQGSLAQILDGFLLLRILRAAYWRQRSEAQDPVFIDIVPARSCTKRPHGFQILCELRRIFLSEHGVLLRKAQRLLQIPFHPCRRFFQALDQIRAPRRLLRLLLGRKRIGRLARLHPALRIDAAAHRAVDRKQQLRQPPVVAPVAELIDQRPERVVLAQGGIALLHQRIEHLLPQLRGLLLFRHAEIRRNVQQVRIVAQDGRTEGVDR